MELTDYHIKGKTRKITIAPIGDIQFGAAGCNENLVSEAIVRGVGEGWHFIGMGDYLDTVSPSNKRALIQAKSHLYDSAIELLDDAFTKKADALVDGPLKESKGRWIGMIDGDHNWTLDDGQTIDNYIANRLKAPYLATSAIVNVYASGVDVPLKIFLTHGAGSSVSKTGKTLHLERLLSSFDVDVVVMGHSHLRYGVPIPVIRRVETKAGPRLREHNRIGAITGSFLNGYQANSSHLGKARGSYVEAAALSPVSLGHILIDAEARKHDWGWQWHLTVTA